MSIVRQLCPPTGPQKDRLAQLARKYQDAGCQSVANVKVYGILLHLLVGVLLYFPHLSSVLLLMVVSPSWHSFNSPRLQLHILELPSANSPRISTN
jgi:hypothetical protein